MEQARHAECQQRELATKEENQKLDTLIQGLVYGVEDAIQEYVSIMLGNSAYPESFSVEHDFTFDSSLSELVSRSLCLPPRLFRPSRSTSTPKQGRDYYHFPDTEGPEGSVLECGHAVALRSLQRFSNPTMRDESRQSPSRSPARPSMPLLVCSSVRPWLGSLRTALRLRVLTF